jgi:ABC-type transport system substrate-binding protein
MAEKPEQRTGWRPPLVVVGALSLLLGSAACRDSRHPNAQPALATLRVGISVGEMATADPQNGVRQVAQNLSIEGLVKFGEDGRPTAWLAQSWAFTPDGRSLKIQLRPGVTFHDGSPVTASSIATSLQRVLPDMIGPVFEDVESIEAIGESAIDIRLRRHSPFVLEALDVQLRSLGPNPVGTGPFKAAGPTAPDELRANEHYYLGHPLLDRIVVSTYPTVRAAWAEMLRDHLDMLFDVGTDALDSLDRATNVSSFTFVRRYQYALIFNTHKADLRSQEVRHALTQAIDRDAIVREALDGHGIPSSGPIWLHHWALGPASKKPVFDPATSAKALASHPLHFTCLVPADYERLALVVKRQLQAVGVSMDVKELRPDEIYAAMARRDFDAVLFEVVSGPSIFRPFRWWYSGPKSQAGFSSPAVDAALDRVRHASSDDEYRSGVASFQRAIEVDPPAIFLAWSERARAVSKRFVVPSEPGRDILATIRFWKPIEGGSPSSRN